MFLDMWRIFPATAVYLSGHWRPGGWRGASFVIWVFGVRLLSCLSRISFYSPSGTKLLSDGVVCLSSWRFCKVWFGRSQAVTLARKTESRCTRKTWTREKRKMFVRPLLKLVFLDLYHTRVKTRTFFAKIQGLVFLLFSRLKGRQQGKNSSFFAEIRVLGHLLPHASERKVCSF